ncbi:hypothetical protein GNH96_03470 [Methylococcus geothermalis]|uniref:DOMON-like domain-containing protein n=1 Tax=Methylococcus geothermalis TaxID=2681310 RepID=A0A858QC86_9GAMM|nr:hypothetical protein GNH96_03470 [Methylococcus geothermalis]
MEVKARRPAATTVELSFVLQGELAALSFPSRSHRRWVRGLWEHTCFEVFVKPENGSVYHEFNFSPSGEWAAFAFSDYRDGKPFGERLQPAVTTRRTETRFELDAIIGPELLPGVDVRTRLWIACGAVVEDSGGTLSYWALRHPADVPDFHHPDGFTLELASERHAY